MPAGQKKILTVKRDYTMQKAKYLLIGCLLLATLTFAQNPQMTDSALLGYWEGAYSRHGSIQIVKLELFKEQGKLLASMSVPERGWFQSRVSEGFEFRDGWLQYDLLYGKTRLYLDEKAGELRGEAIDDEDSTVSKVQLKRVLKPVAPPLTEQNYIFKAGQTDLAGTLVRPVGNGPHPAVIIVQGRGYGKRWGQYREARRLAEHGLAAFIFDGRGRGESGGSRETATAEDRFADVEAALTLLQNNDHIDKKQIGLWGISAGGWVSSIVAKRTATAAFLILDVGPAESLAEQQGHVVEYKMRWFAEQPFTENDYRAAFNYQKMLVELCWQNATWQEIEPLVADARQQAWGGYVDLPEDINNSELDYFRRRKGFDPTGALRTLKIPVLAIYGGRDFVVPARINAAKLQGFLEEAGNQDFHIAVFPEGNHGMSIPEQKPLVDEWPTKAYRWPRMAPGVYETIYPWILEHVSLNKLSSQ